MRYNNIYRIVFVRIAVLLLPTRIRKSVLTVFLRVIYSQIDYIDFFNYRRTTNYRLTHNGQVCYLRAVLNDYFDLKLRRIEIGDGVEAQSVIIYWREMERLVGVPQRGTEALLIGWRGTVVGSAYDFTVRVPQELYTDSAAMIKIAAITREYKLASKQFQIIPLN